MAHPSVLTKKGATELDEAVSLLQELLPEEHYPEVHDNHELEAASSAVPKRSKAGATK